MRMKPYDKRKLAAGIAVFIGVLILLFAVPFEIWLILFGFALIAAGLLIFLKRC